MSELPSVATAKPVEAKPKKKRPAAKSDQEVLDDIQQAIEQDLREKKLAEKLLLRIGEKGGEATPDEIAFLIKVGAVNQSSEHQRMIFRKYESIAAARQQAGVNGEYETASRDLADLQKQASDLDSELRPQIKAMQDRLSKANQHVSAARAVIDRMETARKQLRTLPDDNGLRRSELDIIPAWIRLRILESEKQIRTGPIGQRYQTARTEKRRWTASGKSRIWSVQHFAIV